MAARLDRDTALRREAGTTGSADGANGSRRSGIPQGGDPSETVESSDAPDDGEAEATGEWGSLAPPSPSPADRAALDRYATFPARDVAALPGLAAGCAALVLVGGPVTALGPVALVAVWALGGSVYAGAAVAVLYVATVEAAAGSAGSGTAAPVLLAAVAVAWLLATPLRHDAGALPAFWAIAGAGTTLATVAIGLRVGGVVGAAGLLVAVVAIALYAVHRYSLVRLAGGGAT